MTPVNAKMVDAHCHLYSDAFERDRDEVIKRAEDSGIVRVFVMGEDLDENRRILDGASKYPFVVPFAGYHPWKFEDPKTTIRKAEEVVSFIRDNQANLAGIGEIGLDYFHAESKETRALQKDVLNIFFDVAAEYDLPLSLHSRSAGKYLIEILVNRGLKHVCMHAFDGKVGHALRGTELGFFFSIPTTVVYSQQKRKMVKRLSLEHLLLETDSPALGPVKGERNEPSNLAIVLDTLSELTKESPEGIILAAYDNARKFLGENSTQRWLSI